MFSVSPEVEFRLESLTTCTTPSAEWWVLTIGSCSRVVKVTIIYGQGSVTIHLIVIPVLQCLMDLTTCRITTVILCTLAKPFTTCSARLRGTPSPPYFARSSNATLDTEYEAKASDKPLGISTLFSPCSLQPSPLQCRGNEGIDESKHIFLNQRLATYVPLNSFTFHDGRFCLKQCKNCSFP